MELEAIGVVTFVGEKLQPMTVEIGGKEEETRPGRDQDGKDVREAERGRDEVREEAEREER